MLRYKAVFFLNLIFLLLSEFSYAEGNSENIVQFVMEMMQKATAPLPIYLQSNLPI